MARFDRGRDRPSTGRLERDLRSRAARTVGKDYGAARERDDTVGGDARGRETAREELAREVVSGSNAGGRGEADKEIPAATRDGCYTICPMRRVAPRADAAPGIDVGGRGAGQAAAT